MKRKSYPICECCGKPILNDADGVIVEGPIKAFEKRKKKPLAGEEGEKQAYHRECLGTLLGVSKPQPVPWIVEKQVPVIRDPWPVVYPSLWGTGDTVTQPYCVSDNATFTVLDAEGHSSQS